MAHVKLGRLSKRVPIALTLQLDWDLKRGLDAYSDRYRDAYGEDEPLENLIAAIVSDFIASDRVFNISPPSSSAPCKARDHDEEDAPERLIPLREVCARVSLGKSRIYQIIQAGDFPAPYKLSPGASRWSESEIVDWIEGVKRRAGRAQAQSD